MISRSRAASSASSSIWRSSVRESRSPTCGSPSSRSSPSRGALRGNTPSSRPSRQTTRWGTERIGTSVQIVRWPVRKFARVGRPCRRSASSARTSASASVVAPAAALSPATSSSSRCSSARCQASRRLVAVRASAAAAIAATHESIGWAALSASNASCSRSISSAKRPARSIAPLSTSSSGSTPLNSCGSSSVSATPTSTRSRPARQVPAASESSLNGARCCASRPQRIPVAATHSCIRARSSSSKRKRRRTGSRSARSSTWEAVSRLSARSIRRATTPSTGLVWRSARSASLTRRSVGRISAGSASSSSSSRDDIAGAEGRADQRRERLDVRAHHDHVARLERRVLLEQVQDRVAHHLDLARAAVAGVDLHAAVVRGQQRAAVVVAGQRRAGR